MNRKWIPLVVLVSALAAGPGTSEEAAVPREVRDLTQVFTERMIVAKGKGVAPTDRPLSRGQKEIMALRAAKVVALRELAEILSGVRVSGETCIQDAAARSDQIRASVNGLVKGAEVVHESYDENKEVATVYVRLGLDGPSGLTQTLLPQILQQKIANAPAAVQFAPPAPPPPARSGEPTDALIIDATGKNLRPALINRVVANNGNVLFEPSKIPPEILAKKGCGDYTSDLGKAKAIVASHGAKNPLVIKAAGVTRSTDAQVSEADATVIFTENQRTNFLEGAQVVFVL